MLCPRCNAEGDVSKRPCPQCGLRVHLPTRSGTRPTLPSEPISRPPQLPHATQSSQGPFNRQQSGGMPPISPQSSNGSNPALPQYPNGQQSTRMPSMRRQENNAIPTQFDNSQLPTTPHPSPLPSRIQRIESHREMMEQSKPSLPAQQRLNNAEISPSPSANTIPNTPRPFNTSHEYNPSVSRLRRDDLSESGRANMPESDKGVDNSSISTRGVPHRPNMQPPLNRSTENLSSDVQRSIRRSRLITDSLTQEGQRRSITPSPVSTGPNLLMSNSGSYLELPQLGPGTLLRGGRYRLLGLQGRQDWLEGVFEATWIAQDAQRSGSQVTIRELVTPDSKSMIIQSTLRNATMALTSVGRHAHIPTLWDAFSDQGRNFFVFEPTEGESLIGHMRRTGRALPEQDVIECCLQLTEILEILVQQSPPLVHGLIQPEHIIKGFTSSDYVLTNFSIVLAGGATQYVMGIDRSHLSPYTAPEFVRGPIDVRSDLYSLLATAYHAVTGSLPINAGTSIPQAQRLNPNVSSAFDAILARGIHTSASHRYQRPSELRQDLLAMRSVNSAVAISSSSQIGLDMLKAESPVSPQSSLVTKRISSEEGQSKRLSSGLSADLLNNQEQKLLLPRPEELPPMLERNDTQYAAFWLIGILICLIAIVIVGRGLM